MRAPSSGPPSLNFAFDHYFGRYKGVRSFDDRSVRMRPGDDGTHVSRQGYPAGSIPGAPDPLLPFHIATAPPAPQQGECTNDGRQWADQHPMWNNGSLAQWVTTHLVSDPGPPAMPIWSAGPWHFRPPWSSPQSARS